MPDLPMQSVTEERYKDENGHTVVKKVTQFVYDHSCMFYPALFTYLVCLAVLSKQTLPKQIICPTIAETWSFMDTVIVFRRNVTNYDDVFSFKQIPQKPKCLCTCDPSQVTRKVIRKCVSVDGVERDHVSKEGDAQGSISVLEGGGYSKVVKRTVIKSEGGHTEVCAVYYASLH